MYVTNFLCTYKQHDDADQDDMYRAQYLQAFGLDDWDEKKISLETQRLYILFKNIDTSQSILHKLKNSKDISAILSIMGKCDDDILFSTLFRFDLFDESHRCFCDMIEKNHISETNSNRLLKAIK